MGALFRRVLVISIGKFPLESCSALCAGIMALGGYGTLSSNLIVSFQD